MTGRHENGGYLVLENELSRLRMEVALLILKKAQLEAELLEATLIVAPFADLATAFSESQEHEMACAKRGSTNNGNPSRLVKISVGHLRWAQKWFEELKKTHG
jgi:hypothetical protein